MRFEGHYHGWIDNVCWGNAAPSLSSMGDRNHPVANPWSKGLAEGTKNESILLPWNDLALVEKTVVEKHQEIAAILGISEGTSKSNLFKAKRILKEKIAALSTINNQNNDNNDTGRIGATMQS